MKWKNTPLTYLLAYVGVIIIWAALYCTLVPHDFYAPYARFEVGSQEDADRLRAALTTALRRAVRDRNLEEVTFGDWVLNANSIRASHVRTDDGSSVRFGIVGYLMREDKEHFFLRLDVEADPRKDLTDRIIGEDQIYYFHSLSFSVLNWSLHEQFERQYLERAAKVLLALGSDSAPDRGFGLRLSNTEDDVFQSYIRGIRGDPADVTGNIWRMLYFSTVVISSLGLGDIVPLSVLARALVSLEVLAGIIIIGLFLNALARRASAQSTPDRDDL